jgi:hypothetical protein
MLHSFLLCFYSFYRSCWLFVVPFGFCFTFCESRLCFSANPLVCSCLHVFADFSLHSQASWCPLAFVIRSFPHKSQRLFESSSWDCSSSPRLNQLALYNMGLIRIIKFTNPEWVTTPTSLEVTFVFENFVCISGDGCFNSILTYQPRVGDNPNIFETHNCLWEFGFPESLETITYFAPI